MWLVGKIKRKTEEKEHTIDSEENTKTNKTDKTRQAHEKSPLPRIVNILIGF